MTTLMIIGFYCTTLLSIAQNNPLRDPLVRDVEEGNARQQTVAPQTQLLAHTISYDTWGYPVHTITEDENRPYEENRTIRNNQKKADWLEKPFPLRWFLIAELIAVPTSYFAASWFTPDVVAAAVGSQAKVGDYAFFMTVLFSPAFVMRTIDMKLSDYNATPSLRFWNKWEFRVNCLHMLGGFFIAYYVIDQAMALHADNSSSGGSRYLGEIDQIKHSSKGALLYCLWYAIKFWHVANIYRALPPVLCK